MSRWWRAYDDALNNPKLQRLPGNLFKAWFNLCCLASKSGGCLPALTDIAFALRISQNQALKIIEDLKSACLIDERDGALIMHDWDDHQYQSDSSAERMRRHRRRHRDGGGDVTVTVQNRTESETDTEQNRQRARSRARKPDESSPQQELEAVLDATHAAAVVDHRKRLRKPLSPHAAKLLAGKFAKAADANAAADAMIANGWQGFEPQWLANRNSQSNGPPRRPTYTDAAMKILSETGSEPNGVSSSNHDVKLISSAPGRS